MTTTRNQTQPYHHGDLRNALLQAGAALLREEGIAGLSLRAVARRAGVSHAGPYRHFKNKAALLAALATVGFEALTNALRGAAAGCPDDPVDQLIEAGVAYVTLALDNPERTQLMFGNKRDQGTSDMDCDVADTAFNTLVEIIQNGIDAGVYAGGDARQLAISAWAKVHGLAVLMIAGRIPAGSSPDDRRATARQVCRVELFGLKNMGALPLDD